jgi:hypothetical protein
MREDYMEKLDQMFPEGYVIVYSNPNDTLRLSLYNPNKYEQIAEIHDLLKDEFNRGE